LVLAELLGIERKDRKPILVRRKLKLADSCCGKLKQGMSLA
jgi:hypothetical protein